MQDMFSYFAQNIVCSTSTNTLCFRVELRKITYTPVKLYKMGFKGPKSHGCVNLIEASNHMSNAYNKSSYQQRICTI